MKTKKYDITFSACPPTEDGYETCHICWEGRIIGSVYVDRASNGKGQFEPPWSSCRTYNYYWKNVTISEAICKMREIVDKYVTIDHSTEE